MAWYPVGFEERRTAGMVGVGQKVGIAEKQRSYEIESLFVFICARINIHDSELFQ
jgi:hypothetical protein